MNQLLTTTRQNVPISFFVKLLALLFFAVAFTQLSFGQTCPNLVTNGDFSQGNTGFTSSFVSGCTVATNCQTGFQCVTTNFQTKCNLWPNSGSTAPSAGNFMAVDGFTSGTAPFNIWKQTSIPVVLGKTYTFSFWVKSIHPTTVAGQDYNIDMVITPSTGAAVVLSNAITSTSWIQYTKTWTSTLTGTVDLTLRQPVAD
jgi:hypothetical protein